MSKKYIAGVMAAVSMTFAANALATPMTQSVGPVSADSYWDENGWNQQALGSVTLSRDTRSILGLTSTMNVVDQGWGNQEYNNGVRIGLFDNSTMLWSALVAGADHTLRTVSYDITSYPAALEALNTALAGVNWNDRITMQMYTTPDAWPYWELHVSNAVFSLTSDVPEPTSMALFGLSLAALAAARRRQAR